MTSSTAVSPAADAEVRRSGIGGSDCAVIFGLNPYKTRYQLYLEKVGEITPPDLSDNEAVYWGTVHEDNVARRYAEKMGVKVRRNNRTLRHPDHAFLMAHLDREVVGSDTILECKTAGEYMSGQWGDEFTAQVPEHYLLQCLHYLVVTGKSECHLAVLIGGNKHRIYIIRAADFAKEMEMIPVVVGRFWQRVIDRDPPDLETIEDVTLRWPNSSGAAVQAGTDTMSWVEELQELKKQIKNLQSVEEHLKFKICEYIGDAAELLNGDQRVATFKGQATRRIDTAALKKAEPDIAEKFTTTTTSRVLRLNSKKGNDHE